MDKCLVEGCDSNVRYKGMCGKHYKRAWRHGSPLIALIEHSNAGKICSTKDCNNPVKSKGRLCDACRCRFQRKGYVERDRREAGTGTFNKRGLLGFHHRW